MKNLLIPIFLIILSFNLFSQSNEEWKLKVSDKVFYQYTLVSNVEYLVQFRDKPDLSLTKTFSDKNEKTAYVYKNLKSFSSVTQKRLIKLLNENDITYKSFFIVNAVLVFSDFNMMSKVAKLPEVKFIEANPSSQNERNIEVDNLDYRAPNSVEWGIEKINADDVWDLGHDGSGVVVGGQDTGVRWTHEALKLKYRGWDGTESDHNYNWHDAIDENDANNSGTNPCGYSIKVPCDDHNHGSHTVGTMVGNSGDNEIGVAPGAKWIACRNMERGWGKPSTYIECFEWFLAPTDTNEENANTAMAPDVINNSWHCPESEGCDASNYSTMEDAVNNLRAAGIVVVVSAGNNGSNCSSINSPPNFFSASFDVGATNSIDTIASFSSRGPTSGYGSSILKPNISAPGVSVKSCNKGSDSSYGYSSGTSMAGPHVAGAVALLIDAYPNLKGNPDQIESILQESAIFLDTDQSCGGVDGTEIPNNTYGYGRLDILAAINNANTLPMNIISFDCEKTYLNEVVLNFEVEIDNLRSIEIQRSTNGFVWEILKELDDEFSFLDIYPNKGTNYYRLKIYLLNGEFIFSKVISIDIDSKVMFTNYPSVISKTQSLNLIINGEVGSLINCTIIDFLGRITAQKTIFINSIEEKIAIPIINANCGVHFIKLQDLSSGRVLGKQKFIVL